MAEQESQLEFADVVDFERVPGDEAYVEWIRAGRPRLDHPRHPSERHVQDVLPSL